MNTVELLYLQPFNATRISASSINNRVRELEKRDTVISAPSANKAGFWEEFEVCIFISLIRSVKIWCNYVLCNEI